MNKAAKTMSMHIKKNAQYEEQRYKTLDKSRKLSTRAIKYTQKTQHQNIMEDKS